MSSSSTPGGRFVEASCGVSLDSSTENPVEKQRVCGMFNVLPAAQQEQVVTYFTRDMDTRWISRGY